MCSLLRSHSDSLRSERSALMREEEEEEEEEER